VIEHDAMPVGKNWQVIRRRVFVAQEEALGNQQVIEIPTLSHDGVVAPDRSRFRMFVDRASQDSQPLNRDMAGFDLNSVRHAIERIRPIHPCFR
jgi:hypothetical protein